jgi:hypothetical protein
MASGMLNPRIAAGRNLSTSPCQNFGKNLYALQFASAHRRQIQSLPSRTSSRKGSLDVSTFARTGHFNFALTNPLDIRYVSGHGVSLFASATQVTLDHHLRVSASRPRWPRSPEAVSPGKEKAG